MKKFAILLALVASTAIFAHDTNAEISAGVEKPVNRTGQLYFNPANLLVGSLEFGSELKVASFASITGKFFFLDTNLSAIHKMLDKPMLPDGRNLFMFTPSVGVKFYLMGDALNNGFYIWPEFRAGYAKLRDANNNEMAEVATIGAKATVGYNWVFENGFTFSGGIGVIYDQLLHERSGLTQYILAPAVDYNIGYSF